MSLAFWIILAVLVAAFLALAFFAHVFYPLGGEPAQRLKAVCADGWELAVWKRPARHKRFAEPIVLCHGLGNNHRVFDLHAPLSLSLALAEAGFDVYAVDLRGAGQSQRSPKGAAFHASIDDHVQFDVLAALELARSDSGGAKVLWVGHSLGGLVGLSAMTPDVQALVAGVVTIGSPVFFSGLQGRTKAALALGRFAAWPRRVHLNVLARLALPLAGITPAYFTEGMLNAANVDGSIRRRSLASMIAPIWRGVLLQMSDWVTNDVLRSRDGKTDYRERIAKLTVPLLTVGGAVDRLAPLDAVKKAHELAGSPDKTLLVEWPDGVQYGHGDLLLGRQAPTHVYVRLIDWLGRHSTALAESPAPGADPARLPAAPL
ncbi:MAG: alpha/beta fold hydrolase [Myxococcaceae bacterium]|nr:alpha/beta fold hydrolase [Myxococcaceae bacterium]